MAIEIFSLHLADTSANSDYFIAKNLLFSACNTICSIRKTMLNTVMSLLERLANFK